MGFYGNIKSTSRTQFSFDKTYSSRAEMENSMATDGIYAGRFVLIEYDKSVDVSSFPQGFLKDGIVYQTIPNTFDSAPVAYQIAMTEETKGSASLLPGSLIHIPIDYNFDKEYYDASGVKTDVPRAVFMFVVPSEESGNAKKEVPIYAYDRKTGTLVEKVEENKVVTHEVTYAKTVAFSQGAVSYVGATEGTDAYANYIFNYNVDRQVYGVARGYDSTVWQKVYENAASKYVMVAELNSVVPTFDITADSPTTVPVQPHFDTNSTNVYYKLHTQPQWGFRIKAKDPDLFTPKLQTSGAEYLGDPTYARIDDKEYPSDAVTEWTLQTYNPNNGEGGEKVFAVNVGNGSSGWVNRDELNADTDVPAAIYFNKAGFNPAKISYSADKEYAGWHVGEDNQFHVSDEITITPTGQSGHYYNTHHTGIREIAPDTQELSIMLPSIGDSMAEIWDLIYGGRNLDPEATTRNMDVSWYNAKAVSNKTGVRLINTIGPGQYTYNTKAASTVAGILNSAQDLMGMIITDELPGDVSTANGDYIYYDAEAKKYKFKHKTFKYTEKTFPNNRIPDDYKPFDPIVLDAWDKAYFYVDSATASGLEFIMEDKFYKDRTYIEVDRVKSLMSAIDLSEEYKPNGSFYLKQSDSYASGVKYDYFVATKETYDSTHTYYQITLAPNQLGANDAIYIPNKYYYIVYEKVELTPSTYEKNTYYFKQTAAGDVITYHLCGGETIEDNKDFAGNKVVEYYKRQYILSTDLTMTPGRIYYTVLADDSQTSNAYYTQIKEMVKQTGLTYEMYQANEYYYEVSAEEAKSFGAYEYVSNKYYVKDTVAYTSEESFAEAGRTYFSLKITYKLVQGSDIIEITDENAVEIENMHDMSEFQGANQDVFYIWTDDKGAKRYIEVNYNNFQQAYNSISRKYEIVVLTYKKVGQPYHANGYYYEVQDSTSSKNGSYLIDNNDTITPGRQYYLFNKPDDEGKTVDITPYLVPGETLKYYSDNEYYIESPEGSGNYIIADSVEKENVTYWDPTKLLYVLNDANGIYDMGAEWPMEIKQIPEDVQLATREVIWELKALPEFGDKLVTLHGLLLALYKHLNEDPLTRDSTLMRGALNQFNDLMHRFADLVPGQFTIVDDYGRMHSAQHSTAQALSFEAITDANAQTIAGNKAATENALITLSINSDFREPSLSITHSNANKISGTTSSDNMNTKKDDVLVLETPLIDNAGHVVGKNKHSVTMPFGFKFVTPANSSALGDLTANTTQIEADNTQDNLTFASQNKWIKVAAQDNTLKIAHAIVGTSFGEQKTNSQDSTPKFGDTFNVPVITVDNAGHVTAFTTETVRIPGLTYQEDTGTTNDVVLNIAYSYNTDTDTGEFVETRGKVDTLKIQDYDISGVASAKLVNTDTIHGAFAKLQAQINAMDLAKVGGGTGEYLTDITVVDGIVTANKATLPSVTDTAVTGEFVSKVSETHGQISVSRIAFEPSITIGAGTADAAPSVNVTVNSKSGVAQALTIATTGVYGVTKLTNEYSSTSTNLAMTGAGVNAAISTLKADGAQLIDPSKTIKTWKENNGIVTIEVQDILITDANIAEDANIAMSKINGLSDALTKASNDVLGSAEDTAESMTVHGLSLRIDNVIGTDADTVENLSLIGLSKKTGAMMATGEDTPDTLSIRGLSLKTDKIIGAADDTDEILSLQGLRLKTDKIVGTEEDDATQKTIYGLLAKIAELEARINELHPAVEEEEEVEGEETPTP